MSEENVELWRTGLQGFMRASAKSDWDAWLTPMQQTLDPDIELDASDVPVPDLVGIYRGREAVVRWWRGWLEAWETLEFDYKLVDAGDRVVLLLDQKMRGRSTGIEVPVGKYAHVATFRDGSVVRYKIYMSSRKPSKPPGCGSRPHISRT